MKLDTIKRIKQLAADVRAARQREREALDEVPGTEQPQVLCNVQVRDPVGRLL